MSIIQISFDLLYVRAKPHAVRSEAAERPEMDWFLMENNLYEQPLCSLPVHYKLQSLLIPALFV